MGEPLFPKYLEITMVDSSHHVVFYRSGAVRREKMNPKNTPLSEKTFACETCSMRKKAEANPQSLMARLWRWHTGWCPGWKAYQAHLANQK